LAVSFTTAVMVIGCPENALKSVVTVTVVESAARPIPLTEMLCVTLVPLRLLSVTRMLAV
jgi:hypothetical protein